MSYSLSVWQSPTADALPADRAAADAQLAGQRALGRGAGQNPRFPALSEALYERFPPTEDQGDNEVWVDASEDGVTELAVWSFGLLGGRFFTPAYRHAVAQCQRLGLNLHDPQSGDHFLADGRCLRGDGQTEAPQPLADALWQAELAWRQVDWPAAVAGWRQAAAAGAAPAWHELGRVLRLGLTSPPQHQLGAALMVLAAVDHPACEQARNIAYHALAPGLQRELPDLLARLRAAPKLLAGLDEALATEQARRAAVAPWPRDARGWNPERLTALWRLAADGMADAAERLAQALETSPDRVAELGGPPATDAPAMAAQLRVLAAEAGAPEAQVALAQRLLAGEEGWALDPAGALLWLRRAHLAQRPGLDKAVRQLAQRLAQGWDAAAERARAQALMPGPPDQTVHSRLARLRRACALDLPEAWREMGQAHLVGVFGLPKDPVLGAALTLYSHKLLCTSSHTMPAWARACLPPLHDSVIDDALHLCRGLVGAADPWALIDQAQLRPERLPAVPTEPAQAAARPASTPANSGQAPFYRPAADRPAAAPSTPADPPLNTPPDTRPGTAAAPRDHTAPRAATAAGWGLPPGRPGRAAETTDAASAPMAWPPSRQPPAPSAQPPRRPHPAPPGEPLPSLPGSLVLLWLGAAGAVLLLGTTGALGGGSRLGLVLLGACAAAGAWGCAAHLGRGLAGRLLAAGSAAVPGLGLLLAGGLSSLLWRRRKADLD